MALVVKNPNYLPMQIDLRDIGSMCGSRRSAGGRHGNPLQRSCLENPTERGPWWAIVCGVTHSRTQLKRLSTYKSMGDGVALGTTDSHSFPNFPAVSLLCQSVCESHVP